MIRGFDNGDFTVARVFPNGSNYKSVEKKHKDDIVFSDQGSSTYNLSFNIDRQAYEITTKTTDAQKSSTKKAILNKDFRQAVLFAFNRPFAGHAADTCLRIPLSIYETYQDQINSQFSQVVYLDE